MPISNPIKYTLHHPIIEITDDHHIKIKSNGGLLQVIIFSILYPLMMLTFGFGLYVSAGMLPAILLVVFIFFGWIITFKYFLPADYFLIDVESSVLERHPVLGKPTKESFDINALKIDEREEKSGFKELSLTYSSETIYCQSRYLDCSGRYQTLKATYQLIIDLISNALKYKNTQKAASIVKVDASSYQKAFLEFNTITFKKRLTGFAIHSLVFLMTLPFIMLVLLLIYSLIKTLML